jgi:ATPase subunit of ABC transporter with duplicated ATPase domains
MSMLASLFVHNLSFALPDGTELFSHLDLVFGPHRTGLVGRNGTGKTTLVRLITGALEPSSGTIERLGRIGLLEQSVLPDSARVGEVLGVTASLARLARIEAGTASDTDHAEADWTLPARIEMALSSIGLPSLPLDRPSGTLSGGQRTRLALARFLIEPPDVLILDEPTNNLDAEGRAAVADLLRQWRGAAIVVSHDRSLLNEMDAIVELTTLGATTYGGNWEHYSAQKALELAAAEHDFDHATRRLDELDRKAQLQRERKQKKDAAGARKAERGDIPRILLGGMKRRAEETTGAMSRLAETRHADAAADLAAARAEIEVLTPLSVTLPPTGLPAGRTVLDLVDVRGGHDPERPIIRDFSLKLIGPERVAITGPNGAGKSTLLHLATGRLAPASGLVRITPRHVLLDQKVSLLDPAQSIRDNYRRLNPADDENACRAALARFMFRADAALQLVGTLSGGETLRAGLAATIGSTSPPELLILDEPTNHLDIDAIAELEAGLRAYDGALLAISHDRAFLDAIGITRELGL